MAIEPEPVPPGPEPWIKPHDFARTKPRAESSVKGIHRDWLAIPGVGYRLTARDIGIQFDVTRVRSHFQELHALLTVRVEFRGANTIEDKILTSADFNLSSLRARTERAKHCSIQSKAAEINWIALLEELCLRVLDAEESGTPELPLSSLVSTRDTSPELDAAGLPLLRRQPTIWFGDGGSAKSYLALYAAVDLAQAGERVLYCDWEFSGEEHAARLRRFLGPQPGLSEHLWYRRCDHPLVNDVVNLKRIIAERHISFLICDSVGFACIGPPEAAEAATGYFRAVRELGEMGSLHLAHISKSEQGDQRPFGSIFWANGARSLWYLKRTSAEADESLTVGFFHRKSNVGKLRAPLGMRLDFAGHETLVTTTDPADHEELAPGLPVWQRMRECLADCGAMTTLALAESLGVPQDTVRKTAARQKQVFERVLGGDGIQKLRLVKSV